MPKFTDIKQELLTTFQAAIDEFVAAAETAETRPDDPASISNVKISIIGLSSDGPSVGIRNLNVVKNVPS